MKWFCPTCVPEKSAAAANICKQCCGYRHALGVRR